MRDRCIDCVYYCREYGFCYTGRGNHPMVCPYYIPEPDDDSVTISTTATALAHGEIVSSYELSYEATVIRRANRLIDEYAPQSTCFSCGAPLHAVNRGSRKYCNKCGCYLPKTIYETDIFAQNRPTV